MQEAHDLEQQRTQARNAASRANAQGAGMGKAVGIFQIAIALSSICLVTKKRPLWYISLALAVAATEQMIHVWLS